MLPLTRDSLFNLLAGGEDALEAALGSAPADEPEQQQQQHQETITEEPEQQEEEEQQVEEDAESEEQDQVAEEEDEEQEAPIEHAAHEVTVKVVASPRGAAPAGTPSASLHTCLPASAQSTRKAPNSLASQA